jgi:hypothetical protein
MVPAAALAALFDLTAAEMRTLEYLLAGDTPAQAADKLGIQNNDAQDPISSHFRQDRHVTITGPHPSGQQIFPTHQAAMKRSGSKASLPSRRRPEH